MRLPRRWLALALLVGCSATAPAPEVNSLGIARYEVRETVEHTTVLGLAADGTEIGRLDLLHGHFRLSDTFAEGVDERDVVGRKLDVQVLEQSLRWESPGFIPTMSLPAHPAGRGKLSEFIAAAPVRSALLRWGIAFQSAAEADGYAYILNGTNACDCMNPTGTVCPTVVGTTPNICNNNPGATDAWVVHQRPAPGYDVGELSDELEHTLYDESWIVQCCPGADGVPTFARKSCSDRGRGQLSTCGMALTNAFCTACPQYPSLDGCRITAEPAGWSDPDAPLAITASYCNSTRSPEEQRQVWNVYARWGWRCGDGTCDVGEETCATCAADCACEGFETCGGGGEAGVCGCTPTRQCPDGFECGTIDDGCGGTLDCSGGRTCEQIAGKTHYQCVADSHRCCKHGRCAPEEDDQQ